MKKSSTLCAVLFLLFVSSVCTGQELKIMDSTANDTSASYRDGIFEGRSRAKYVGEPYWGIVKVTIRKGSLTDINFMIRDSALHETFNEYYEKHFEGNPVYIEQSRNDWKGVQIYPKMFSDAGDLDKIDAITGATWSYNIFRAAVKRALKSAETEAEKVTAPDSTKF